MTLWLIAAGAFAATMLGGWLALRLRDRLHLILGFSAGAVIAVAFFDLLPEALDLGFGFGTREIISFAALGFLMYLLLDRVLLLHTHAHEHDGEEHTSRGSLRAGSLSLHSLIDGIGIGLAFQVDATVGIIVAVAVLAHDFSDGINTVSVVVRHGGSRLYALRWLLIDAIAPVLGIAATFALSVTPEHLSALLALFSGFFLYIGASDLIPESHHAHPTFWTTFSTLLGAGVLYTVIRLAGV
jgi:ZIP family zinc transporter